MWIDPFSRAYKVHTVAFSCPHIDDFCNIVHMLKERLESPAEMTRHDYSVIDKAVIRAINDIERVREINDTLRKLAEEYAGQADEMAKEIERNKASIYDLQMKLDDLKYEMEQRSVAYENSLENTGG
jgi:uncharacterized coiled-coil DUF342 family protein